VGTGIGLSIVEQIITSMAARSKSPVAPDTAHALPWYYQHGGIQLMARSDC